FDDAAAAAELSEALSSELGAEVARLDGVRRQRAKQLRQSQRDAAAELVQQKRRHDVDWWWEFTGRTGRFAGALAALAGLLAAMLAPGRRWLAGAAVVVSVAVIAGAVLLYYLLPVVAALAGAVAAVVVLALAVRSAR
ncbi:MAG TPA: hypothetical protein VHW23_47635, partial [Kofleriaceae bacterium]|nr:hypothetical protein [Kofleriaceae bacterium]